MRVRLDQGESLIVEFFDSDHEVTVSYTKDALSINSELPDSAGRKGELFAEHYGKVKAVEDEDDQEGPDEEDPTIIWQKGPYRVRQNIKTERYHVFDKKDVAEGEDLEHDHMVDFHDLKGAKQYIALQLKNDMEKGKNKR